MPADEALKKGYSLDRPHPTSRAVCTHLNEGVNVVHQGLCSTNDELVHTGDGVRSNGQGRQ